MSEIKKKHYAEEFKKQIVMLRKSGKGVKEIAEEYKLARSTINGWVNFYENTGSFKHSDNRSEQEKELIRLNKENKQLLMEVDILKAAALIMSRK